MINNLNLFQSVKAQGVNELLPEFLEVGLDSLTESEVLQDIPVFGIAFKSYNLYQKVSETFFVKKLLYFLYELKDIPLFQREKYIEKLEASNESNKAGEKLLVMINRLNDVEKAKIIGRLFNNTILGKIEYSTFSRLTHIIDHAYIDDIKLLENNIFLEHISVEIKSNLHQLGLLHQKISDMERERKFLARVGSSKDAQPKFEYNVNEYCIALIEYGF